MLETDPAAMDGQPPPAPAAEQLPTVVHVSEAFSSRALPPQRLVDQLVKIEGVPFSELGAEQPFRIVAVRALLRDYPGRDLASLWLHAYDCEVQVDQLDPTAPS
jgi:hypothetical protein